MARRKGHSKKSNSGCISTVILSLIITAIISTCSNNNNSQKPVSKTSTPGITPQNVETMVSILMNQDATATQIAILSITPTPSITPTFTFTFISTFPTETPIPSATPGPYEAGSWLPGVIENDESTWNPEISESSYHDDSSWIQYTSEPEYFPTESSSCNNPSCGCVIKGNINSKGKKIYHCPNSPNYDDTRINKPGERYFCTEAEAIAAGFSRTGNTSYCGF